jgi:hypothetical protein
MNLEEMQNRIKELEKQVAVLRDIEDIQRLQKSYGFYLQNWLYEEIIDLFCDGPEAKLNIMVGVFSSKESVRKYFSSLESLAVNPEFLHQAMQLSGIVDIKPDGQTAEGRWFALGAIALPMGNGVKPMALNGIYTSIYIKQDGKWKIKELNFHPIFMCPPEEGWVKKERIAAAATGARQGHAAKPDQPREIDPRYPSGYIVPFHFTHPVTGKKSSEAKRNALLKKKSEKQP